MKYLLFAPRFVEPIRRRTKRQTIRGTRRCEPGDVVSLRRWAGKAYRSPQEEIVPPVRCEAVLPVRIAVDRLENRAAIVVGDQVLEHDEVCGVAGNDDVATGAPMAFQLVLTVWREHDRFDKPEHRFVVLCRRCSDKLIEPHPRLYAALPRFSPAPGAMAICSDCAHRDGCRCVCPKAAANGGEGIEIRGPEPTRVHVCRSPRRLSGWELWYRGPSTACTGKEVANDG